MSAIEILVTPSTLMSPVMCSLTSSPLRDLTVRISPSTLSMAPRTRDGTSDFWANAPRVDAATIASAISGRVKL